MTMTVIRLVCRTFAVLALGLFLGLSAFTAPASAQATKEPTDGFFDVPARDPSEAGENYGVPAYMITSALGGAAIFILCKSARRDPEAGDRRKPVRIRRAGWSPSGRAPPRRLGGARPRLDTTLHSASVEVVREVR